MEHVGGLDRGGTGEPNITPKIFISIEIEHETLVLFGSLVNQERFC